MFAAFRQCLAWMESAISSNSSLDTLSPSCCSAVESPKLYRSVGIGEGRSKSDASVV